MTGHRLLCDIADDIRASWPKPYFSAVPYIEAMRELELMSDRFGADSADTVIRYFLANARTWRGDEAQRIKQELRAMLHIDVP